MTLSHIARVLRPHKFTEVIGQDIAVKLIKNALLNKLMLPVCTLFGPSGVGKTTLARLIAMWECCTNHIDDEPCGECVNCKSIISDSHPDVFELDGGTYTGVDNIKSMLEGMSYATSSANRNNKRIYILDEVHMLSRHAMTALLKRFEEPMDNTQFILATTNIEKLPETILSRSFQIRLNSVDTETVALHLQLVARQGGYQIDKESVDYITYAAQGSVRQGLSFLEQATILCGGTIRADATRQMLGLASQEAVDKIVDNIIDREIDKLFELLAELHEVQPMMLMKQVLHTIQLRSKDDEQALRIAYDLAEASIVMHQSPYSDNILPICLGYVSVKNYEKLSDVAKKLF